MTLDLGSWTFFSRFFPEYDHNDENTLWWDESQSFKKEREKIKWTIVSFLGKIWIPLFNKDGVKDLRPVSQRSDEEIWIIQDAAYKENPAQYLQHSFRITEKELIERINSWGLQSKLPSWAQIRNYRFENRYYWKGGVLLETWENGIFKTAFNRIPTQVDWATFIIVEYITEEWQEEEKVFALQCMNGLIREYEEPWIAGTSNVSSYQSIPSKNKQQEYNLPNSQNKRISNISGNEKSWCLEKAILPVGLALLAIIWHQTCSHKPWTKEDIQMQQPLSTNTQWLQIIKEVTIPAWGSLMWTVWMTREQAKNFAKVYWLKEDIRPDGTYIVVIQPWDVVIEWNNWEYQLLRKREVHQN